MLRTLSPTLLPVTLLLALLPAAAQADVVFLEDGRVLRGEVTKAPDGRLVIGSDYGSTTVHPDQVQRVVKEEAPPPPAVRPAPPAPAAVARRADPRTNAVAQLAERIERCYLEGNRAQADRLIASDPRVVAWNDLPVGRTTSHYQSGNMVITLAASDPAPQAVAFPPGTYGEAVFDAADGRHTGRSYQDLVLLRAPVVVIEPGQATTVRIPIACAAIKMGSPRHGMTYKLDRFQKASQIEQLMNALCSGESLPAADAMQLAIWVVRNRVTAGQVNSHGTFGNSGLTVDRADGPEAKKLLIDAGLRPDALPFYNGSGSSSTYEEDPTPPAAEQPPVQPEPEQPRTAPPIQAAVS